MAISRGQSNRGTAVVIYSFNAGNQPYPIHGAYWSGEQYGWVIAAWTAEGKKYGNKTTGLDITKAISEKQWAVD